MMRFRRYSIELYEELGVFQRSGGLRFASSPEQLKELQRGVSRARGIGLEVELLVVSVDEVVPTPSTGAGVGTGVLGVVIGGGRVTPVVWGVSVDDVAARVSASVVRDRIVPALDRCLPHGKTAGVRAVLGRVDADPYRDAVRDAVAEKPLGNFRNGTQIGSNVLALDPVAARGSNPKRAARVGKRNGQAVYFRFAYKVELGVGHERLRTREPPLQPFVGEGVCQAEHGTRMSMRAEALPNLSTHPLRGGIFRLQLGMLRLQATQLLHERVILTVTYDGCVQHVVVVVVLFDQVAELFNASGRSRAVAVGYRSRKSQERSPSRSDR